MKRLAAGLLAAALLAGGVAAVAAGGSSSDPLISQDYIQNTYRPATVKQAEARLSAILDASYRDAETRLKAQADLYLARAEALSGAGGSYAASFSEQRFKRGDVIALDAGSGILLLAGTATLSYTSGGAVDISAAADVSSGSPMLPRHRYLAAEDTLCRVTVTSDTAVIAPEGFYAVSKSNETDYNALADALKAMGMFKGGDTAYGSGYALENAPSRIESLIMFLRLLGEESAALSTQTPCPFVDVPEWCRSYVAYAYEKGYTNGVGADSEKLYFAPFSTVSPGEYVTFVLRALGYQDSGANPDFLWNTALVRAQELGLITSGERTLLTSSPFLRAQVVYLSYFALDGGTKSGGTLLSRLTASGALNAAQVQNIRNTVTVTRIH